MGLRYALKGSTNQEVQVDFRRPLFIETPDLPLPFYLLVVNFGLIDITVNHGPIQFAAGTHRMPRVEALRAIELSQIKPESVPLKPGDVLIRPPRALHRGTPNFDRRASSTCDDSLRTLLVYRRLSRCQQDFWGIWRSLSPEQRKMMRFPVFDD
jgi:Phytanoyl-CoA dioxygenase (PhyH)